MSISPLSNQIVDGLMSNNSQAYQSQRVQADEQGNIKLSFTNIDSKYQIYDLHLLLALQSQYQTEIYDQEQNIKQQIIQLPHNLSINTH